MPKPRKNLKTGYTVKFRFGIFPHKAQFETKCFADIFKKELRSKGIRARIN